MRVVEAYRRRQHDALEIAYMQAAVAATWNSEAVWGKRREPTLDSLLDPLRRPDDVGNGEPTEEHRLAEASFDEARLQARMRVLKEREDAKAEMRKKAERG